MSRLEDLMRQLPPAVQASVVHLIETLVTSGAPGPKVAPPPMRGRPRTPRPPDTADGSLSPPEALADGLADACQDTPDRQALDAQVLEALQARYPLVMTARHVTQVTRLPHPDVRATVARLAQRGVIASPNEGYYRFVPPQSSDDTPTHTTAVVQRMAEQILAE
jgi:hypothetical protein